MVLFHIKFPHRFKWEKNYARIAELNKKVFHTIHLALLLISIAIGTVTLLYAKELDQCQGVAFGLNLLLAMFWLWRSVWQIYYFKGKAMHYVLIAVFALFFIAYLVPVVLNKF